jgi:hypothetical protein
MIVRNRTFVTARSRIVDMIKMQSKFYFKMTAIGKNKGKPLAPNASTNSCLHGLARVEE